jgi:hypothetical protein
MKEVDKITTVKMNGKTFLMVIDEDGLVFSTQLKRGLT